VRASPKAPWTVRVANWCARHRWPVVVLWFAATLGMLGGSFAYVGRYGWVSIKLERIDRPLLEKLLRDAWRATAPKKLRELVPG
jgi:hypothetical protein